jgi:EmrB/QacA subfamily drug resistance transporter
VQGGHSNGVVTPESSPSDNLAGRNVLFTIVLGAMLVPLNSTMIAVALPHLIVDFDTDLSSAGWLVTGYLIAMASLQPVAGKLGDRLGRRTLLLAGLGWFGLSSLGAGLAPNLPILIAFRIQQAVAGALVFPNGIALLRATAPPGRLGRRLGLVMGALPLAAALGPLVAGVLLAFADWRAIFLVNLPLVVVPLVLGWRSLPRTVRKPANAGFDVLGGVLLSVFLLATAWALNRGVSATGATAGVLACVAAALFAAQELRHPHPLIQLRLFRDSQFVAANGGVALSNLAMYVTLFALPVLLSRRGGWTGAQIGLVVTTMTLTMTMFASAPVGGRLADRYGARLPASAGLGLMTSCLVPFALGVSQLSGLAIVALLFGVGAGLGVASVPLQLAAIEAVDVSESGLVAGIFSTSRYLGSITGISLFAGALAPAATGTGGFGPLFAMMAAAAAGSAALSLLLPGRTRVVGAVDLEAAG